MRYYTIKEVSEAWSLSKSYLARLCKRNAFPKAYKKRNAWQIPEHAIKPLTKYQVKVILRSIIRLQNLNYNTTRHDISPADVANIATCMAYLEEQGYITMDTSRPKDVFNNVLILEKGFHLIEHSGRVNIVVDEPLEVMSRLLSIMASIKILIM